LVDFAAAWFTILNKPQRFTDSECVVRFQFFVVKLALAQMCVSRAGFFGVLHGLAIYVEGD